MRRAAACLIAAAGFAAPIFVPSLAPAQQASTSAASAPAGGSEDTIILKDGRIIKGTVLEESDKAVRFKGTAGGIPFETTYERSIILKVVRAATPAAASEQPASAASPEAPILAEPAPQAAEAAGEVAPGGAIDPMKYYLVPLRGKFGWEISQTPLRRAFQDAKRQGAGTIIIDLDAEFKLQGDLDQAPDDAANFDQGHRAEPFMDLLAHDVPLEWGKPPRVVFWVKQAMGGACFLPWLAPEIYFHSEGRMGGIGNLSNLFGGTGDEVVRQKQYALRMARAEGYAIVGGYDPRIMRALAKVEYVLSARYDGNHVELIEGAPDVTRGEILLTDDGEKENADTLAQKVRGEGNDVLTLRPTLAKELGISRGTSDSIEDLLFLLGLDRAGRKVVGGERITKQWALEIDNAAKNALKTYRDFKEAKPSSGGGGGAAPPPDSGRPSVMVPTTGPAPGAGGGGAKLDPEMIRFINTQIRRIEDLQAILRRYEEVLDNGWRSRNGIPSTAELNIEKIKLKFQLIQ